MQKEIQERLISAIKAGDKKYIFILRDIKENFTQAEKIKRKPLNKDDEVCILQKMAKQRRQSIEACGDIAKYTKMKQSEEHELLIIEEYLPEKISIENIISLITKIIKIYNISHDMKNVGIIMKAFNEQCKGQDGKLVSKLVREILCS